MPTYESWLHIATNKERISGEVGIGTSRLPLVLLINYLFKGCTEKDLKEMYPQLRQDDIRVMSRLAKDLRKYKFYQKEG